MSADKTLTLAAQPASYEMKGSLAFHEALIRAAFAQVDYKVKFVYKPWKRVLLEVKNGLLDGAYTAWYDEDRSRIYEYSDAYFYEDVFFFKRLGSSISYKGDLRALKQYTIGVPLGWIINNEFDSADYLTVHEVVHTVQLLKMLNSNRIDLMVTSEAVLSSVIHAYPKIENLAVKIIPKLKRHSDHVIFSKIDSGYKSKRDTFNEGLRNIKLNGVLRKLEQEFQISSGLLRNDLVPN